MTSEFKVDPGFTERQDNFWLEQHGGCQSVSKDMCPLLTNLHAPNLDIYHQLLPSTFVGVITSCMNVVHFVLAYNLCEISFTAIP